jgi:hypothetical protein
MINDDKIKDFFGGLADFAPRCIICGNLILPDRLRRFPETKFCKTECTLKWIASHPEIPEVEENEKL